MLKDEDFLADGEQQYSGVAVRFDSRSCVPAAAESYAAQGHPQHCAKVRQFVTEGIWRVELL